MASSILHKNYRRRHLIIDTHLQVLTDGRADDIDEWDSLLREERSYLITFHD